MNPFSLENKTILVTGASSGIGRAVAVECARMGACVIATARNEQRLNETLQMMQNGNHAKHISDLIDFQMLPFGLQVQIC
jgi:NADP-dependent 3-hydroxy acid dehydrogenase YdfG